MFYRLLTGRSEKPGEGYRSINDILHSNLLENRGEEGKKLKKKKKVKQKPNDANIPNLSKQSCSQAAALKPLNALSYSLAERVGVGLGGGVLLHFIRRIPSLWTLLILGSSFRSTSFLPLRETRIPHNPGSM